MGLIPSEEGIVKATKVLLNADIEALQQKFNEQIKQWDNRMVKIRNELDIHYLTK